ncbi:MAG: hypothetical protein HYS12_20590 [Planctomycetes bacterium]|nr:hypothetical protein [Planctomycetota bacterium]
MALSTLLERFVDKAPLCVVAGRVDWRRVQKAKQGPKKPSASKQRHVSTARLLQETQSG